MNPPNAATALRRRLPEPIVSVVRIQSVVALIVGGSLALAFALGEQFDYVPLALAVLLYGLLTLAWVTRRHPSSTSSRGIKPLRTTGATRQTTSGRVVPLAPASRPSGQDASSELDQLAGR